jgi:ATP-dependent helicase/DNAse subunit B
VPAYFEVEFGNRPQEDRKQDPSSTPKPLLLNRKDEFVELCGKIDRVDVNPDTKEAVAVDYKLNSAVKRKDLEEGIKLQAPLYALALRELFDQKPVGSIYRGITKNNRDGYRIDEKMISDEFEERLEICKERVMDLVLRIAASDISINPGKGACDYCGLDPVCRINQWEKLELQTEAAKDA